MTETTVVHLLRHGEVHNPGGVLYGRLPGFHLSELGLQMAERIAESLAGRDITAVVASPLERAQETAKPTAERFGLEIRTDERLLESLNVFEGKTFGVGNGSMRRLEHWKHLWNPFRPSWGEPYAVVAARMLLAAASARDRARGSEVLCVSHQLPIWIARCKAEGRRLWHDPRSRHCTLASVTSLTYSGDDLVAVGYTEPARDLLPAKSIKNFSAGA